MFSSVFLNSHLNFIKNNILVFLLVLFFCTEALTKILGSCDFEYYRIGVIIKIGFLLFVFIQRKINVTLLKRVSILGFLFILSQIFVRTELVLIDKLLENLIYIAKYLFVFVVADFVVNTDNKREDINKMLKIMFFLLWLNFIAIIIGVLFSVSLFATYYSNRFGYNGFIQMNSHASYIYIFSIIYVVYQYLKTNKRNHNFYMIIISGLLIGTKTLYLFYFLLAIYLIFHFKLYKKPTAYIVLSLIVILGITFRDKIINFLSVQFKALFDLYYDEGLLTALSSKRNILALDTFSMAFNDYWRPINYLIGGGFFNKTRTEMAFVDLFLFWGIIGSGLYLFLYYKFILKYYFFNSFLTFSIISVLFVAFWGGNFFTNAVIAIYIVAFTNFFALESKK